MAPGAAATTTSPLSDVATRRPSSTSTSTSGSSQDYRGFVAGVFSGIAKLSGTYNHAGQTAFLPSVQPSILVHLM